MLACTWVISLCVCLFVCMCVCVCFTVASSKITQEHMQASYLIEVDGKCLNFIKECVHFGLSDVPKVVVSIQAHAMNGEWECCPGCPKWMFEC